MNHEPTFYETLGVEVTAATATIRQAHRKLAQQSHPDKVHHLLSEFPWVEREAAIRYERLTEAFNVLSNDAARRRYDAELNQHWPDFVSRYAPPISDEPHISRRPAPETPAPQSAIHTRASEYRPAQRKQTPHHPFHENLVPRETTFGHFEPHAQHSRKNFFLSALAFIALVVVIYSTSSYQQSQKTSDWLLQHTGGANTSLQSAPALDSDSPLELQPPKSDSLKSKSKPPTPLFPVRQKK